MAFYVYMLHCRGGVFYVGHTDDLEHRIGQHQNGAIPGFVRTYAPALEAERRIKGWSRAKTLALIRGDWELVSALAKSKSGPSTSSGRTEGGVSPPDSDI